MFVVLENLRLMEKQEKRDKENKLVFEFVCYQQGYKNLITLKDIPQDLYNNFSCDTTFEAKCKMTIWGNNNSYGASFRLVEFM